MESTNQQSGKQFMTIRIETSIKNQLQKMADDDSRSLSSQVTLMLKRMLKDVNANA